MELTEIGWGQGYPALWLACFGSGLFFPVPEDVPLMYAGIQVAAGSWGWPATLLVAWLGAGARDLSCWAIGRYLFGWMIRTGRFEWLVNRRRVERAERLIHAHGPKAVMLGRFMVGFRVPFFVAAGAMGVPLRLFVAFDSIGLTIAVPLAVGLGFWFGEPIAVLAGLIVQRAGLVATLLGVGIVAFLASRRALSRRAELARNTELIRGAEPVRRAEASLPSDEDT